MIAIRPITTYVAENMSITQKEQHTLNVWESKIMKKILGPVKGEHGIERGTKAEIKKQLDGEAMDKHIKRARARWLEHVWRSVGTRQHSKNKHGMATRGKKKTRHL